MIKDAQDFANSESNKNLKDDEIVRNRISQELTQYIKGIYFAKKKMA